MQTENQELVVLEEVIYPVTLEQIEAFKSEWDKIPTLDPLNDDKSEYNAVKKAHLQAVKFRTSIEATRKKLKAPALEYGKKVDAIAKEFQETINPKELELFKERKKVDDYEKEQEQKRIDAERERVENISNEITKLKMIPLDSMGKNSEELLYIYEDINIPTSDIFEERLDEAMLVYKDTIGKLELAIETAKKAEQAEAIQAEAEAKLQAEKEAKEEEIRKEREALEKEKEEFRAMKEAQEKEVMAQQEEINKQNAEREAEELAKQQEKEAKEKYTLCRVEAKKAIENLLVFDSREDAEKILDAIISNKIPHVKFEV